MSHLKITHKIYLLVFFPIVIVLYLSSSNVMRAFENNQEAQKLLTFSELAKEATRLLHQFKEERDASLAFLHNDINTTQLQSTQQRSNQYILSFLAIKHETVLTDLAVAKNWQELETMRTQILKKHVSNYLVERYFSEINGHILTILDRHHFNTSHAKVNRDAVALKKLVLLQELAREESSSFYKVFKTRTFDPDIFFTIQTNITQQKQIYQDFLSSIEDAHFREALNTIHHSELYTDLEAYRTTVHKQTLKQQLLSKMLYYIGYGGMIHTFKNYVLRREEHYYLRFLDDYAAYEKILGAYQVLAAGNQAEYNRLLAIEDTFNKYRKNIELIHESMSTESPEKIDLRVRISDMNATNALRELQNMVIGVDPLAWEQLSAAYLEQLESLQELVLSDLLATLQKIQSKFDQTFYSQLLYNIFFIFLLLFLATLIGKNILKELELFHKGLEDFFDYLNFKRSKPAAITINSKDELAEMAEDINAQVTLIHENRKQDEEFITETTQIVKLMKEGDFGEHIYYKPFSPSLIALNTVFNDLIAMIQDKIRAQTEELESMNATLSDQVYLQTLELQNQLQELTQFQFAIDQSLLVTHSNPDGTLNSYNRLFGQAARLRNSSLLDKNSAYLLDPQQRGDKEQEIRTCIAAKRIYKGVLAMLRSDGSVLYTNSTIIPILNTQGDVIDILGLHHDITPIINARDEAIAAEKAKDEFLSNMSHEIRTPLNAILGFVSILKKRTEDEASKHYLDIIDNSGQSLLRIINDILDYSKIQSGKFSIVPHAFEPITEFSNTVLLFASKAYEKHIKHYFYIETTMPECLEADNVRINQILSNLLSNAIKFTPEGGEVKIKITFANDMLTLSIQDSGIGMTGEQQARIFNPFEQADGSTTRQYGGTGLGLSISRKLAKMMRGSITLKSEPDKGSIFTLSVPAKRSNECSRPHYQTDKIKDLNIALVAMEPEDSSAMKLIGKYFQEFGVTYSMHHSFDTLQCDLVIICDHSKAIATVIAHEMHAIVLEMFPTHRYDSYPRVHALHAPFAPYDVMRVLDDATVERLYVAEDSDEEMHPQFHAHILVAEDNKTNQMLIKLILDEYGITYDVVDDGMQAVAAYKANPDYQLVLTDENMPNLSGVGALQQIRAYEKEKELPTTPVVVLTASVLESDREHFIASGMDDFVGKPIDEQQLQNVFKRFLT